MSPIMQSGKWLDDVIINAAHDMIHGQFPGVIGFQQCILVPLFNDAEQHWEVPRIPFP